MAWGGCEQIPPQTPSPVRKVALPVTPKVELRQMGNSFQLYRYGKPYFIRGAVVSAGYLDELVAHGGNSFRTYTTGPETDSLLDLAEARGLTVMLGLYMQPGRLAFDYNDPVAVARQLEQLRQEVRRLKDHPALLLWGIGNEVDLHYPNPNVWRAINDVARMIHEEDPDHPTAAVVLANRKSLEGFTTYCPDVDILAINSFASMRRVTQDLQSKEINWQGPYLFTEWGARGAWEAEPTHWNAPIERTSTAKAAEYRLHYEQAIQSQRERCLGGYVFLWGHKMERTHTWYSLFLENGEKTPVVDEIQNLWTGQYPENRAPQLDSIRLDGKTPFQKVYLHTGQTYQATIAASDPEGAPLSYQWELLPEAQNLHITGGDAEPKPLPITRGFASVDGPTLSLTAPAQPGAYRLFVYVRDGQGSVSTANVPFFVTHGSFR